MDRISKLKAQLSNKKDDKFILFALAKEYETINKSQIALEYYNRILIVDHSDNAAYYNKGLLQESLNLVKEANTTFRLGLNKAKEQQNFEYIKLFSNKI